jgi:hypothetical protein
MSVKKMWRKNVLKLVNVISSHELEGGCFLLHSPRFRNSSMS